MFCPNCGAQNADNAPFCANCGSRFEQQAPAAPVYNPAPGYAPVAPGYTPAPVANPGKGMGIASMVLGILAILLLCTSLTYVAIACAIVGCILGGLGMKKSKEVGMSNGMGVAGLVCSIIALALCVIAIIFVAAFAYEYASFINSLY